MDLPHDNFSNLSLGIDALPKINQLKQLSLAPIYPKVRLALAFVFFSTLLIIGVIAINQTVKPLPMSSVGVIEFSLLITFLVAITVLFYIYFADQQKKYALRELDLHYTFGLIFRKTISQPILRVQHVELKRGPIDRKVGLAKLQVFSAGGAMHTFEIPGLPVEDAESIRQFIISHKDANNNE